MQSVNEASAVVDASALLAFIFEEPTTDAVDLLEGAAMSAVNLSEVLAKIAERGGNIDEAQQEIESLDIQIIPFDAVQAKLAAALRPMTRRLGLGLGDRACLALGNHLNAPILTADSAWKNLRGTAALSVAVRLVR
jgi:PIN domain nuclease of toxin-antitoxin system